MYVFLQEGAALSSAGPNAVSAQSAPEGIAVVIVCFNRPKELQRTVDGILEKYVGLAVYVCLIKNYMSPDFNGHLFQSNTETQ